MDTSKVLSRVRSFFYGAYDLEMRTGYIVDSVDPRDLTTHDLMGAPRVTPAMASRGWRIKQVLDQGMTNTCVTHSIMQSIQILNGGELGSVLYPYYMGKVSRGTQDVDLGTTFRDTFRAMERWGFPKESTWPFRPDRVTKFPSKTAAVRAVPAREGEVDRTTYRRIVETGYDRADAVRRCIAGGYTVCFGTAIDARFQKGDFGTEIQGVPAGTIIGNHAMLIVGYTENYLEVVNSYGIDWADQGQFRMSWEWLASPKVIDMWCIEKAPNPEGT